MNQTVRLACALTRTEIEKRLAADGFRLRYTNPTIRGEPQHRYTICDAESGKFVAWFCWYVTPATNRPNFARSRQEHQVSQIAVSVCSPTDTQLLTEVLEILARLHPVATT